MITKKKTMKFIPILFSTPMVQALNDRTKTQTRRVLKKEPLKMDEIISMPIPLKDYVKVLNEYDKKVYNKIGTQGKLAGYFIPKCPFGEIGDVLWVREKHRAIVNCPDGTFSRWDYYADFPDKYHKQYPSKWKPSLFMPKTACRLFLKIKDRRLERLQDISEYDAKCEGVLCELSLEFNQWLNYEKGIYQLPSAFESFNSLWKSINGQKSWDDNPWVWVIEFERIEKPANFI